MKLLRLASLACFVLAVLVQLDVVAPSDPKALTSSLLMVWAYLFLTLD